MVIINAIRDLGCDDFKVGTFKIWGLFDNLLLREDKVKIYYGLIYVPISVPIRTKVFRDGDVTRLTTFCSARGC